MVSWVFWSVLLKFVWGLVVCFFFFFQSFTYIRGLKEPKILQKSSDFGTSSGNIALLKWHGCDSATDVQSHVPCSQLSSFQCSQHTQSRHYYSTNIDRVMPYYITDTVFRGMTLLLQRNIFEENAASAGVDLWTASVMALPYHCHLMYMKLYFQTLRHRWVLKIPCLKNNKIIRNNNYSNNCLVFVW